MDSLIAFLTLPLLALLSVAAFFIFKPEWNFRILNFFNYENKGDAFEPRSSSSTSALYNDLSSIRTNITSIDLQILNLLSNRRKLVEAVARYKIKNGLPVRDPQREAELLEKLKNEATTLDVTPSLVNTIFELVMADSRSRQDKIIQSS